jgi:hypothetical protein
MISGICNGLFLDKNCQLPKMKQKLIKDGQKAANGDKVVPLPSKNTILKYSQNSCNFLLKICVKKDEKCSANDVLQLNSIFPNVKQLLAQHYLHKIPIFYF